MRLEQTIQTAIFKFIEQTFDLADPQKEKERLREAQIKKDFERQLALTQLRSSLDKTKTNLAALLKTLPGISAESRDRADSALHFINMVRGAVDQAEFEGQMQGNLNDALENASVFLNRFSGAAPPPKLHLSMENLKEGAETLKRNVELGLKMIMQPTAFGSKPLSTRPELSALIAHKAAGAEQATQDTTPPDIEALDRLLSEIGIKQLR